LLKVWQEVCVGDEDQFGVSFGMLNSFPCDSGTHILANGLVISMVGTFVLVFFNQMFDGSRSDLSGIAKVHSCAFCLTFPDRVLKIITLSAHVFIK